MAQRLRRGRATARRAVARRLRLRGRAAAGFFDGGEGRLAAAARRRAVQPGTWRSVFGFTTSAPAGTSRRTVVPVPTYASSPTETGATSCESLPIWTRAPITVRLFW